MKLIQSDFRGVSTSVFVDKCLSVDDCCNCVSGYRFAISLFYRTDGNKIMMVRDIFALGM